MNEERFDEFTVTEKHLKLLRAAYVGWDGCEFGAPAIDCKRPYGNGDVIGDMAKILGLSEFAENDDFREDYGEGLIALHRETQTALQIVLSTGQFKAGKYRTPRYHRNQWESVPSSHREERE